VSPKTDRQLLAEFAERGSQEAFGELVGRYAALVSSVCRRVLGDAHAAEDAAQATFLVLARRAAGLKGERTLSGWLFQTAQLTARNARRMEERRARHEREAAMVTRTGSAPDPVWAQVAPELDLALLALPRNQRDALLLRYYRGLSEAGVAEDLGCSRPTAGRWLAEGIERLRRRLAGKGAALSAAALGALLAERAVEAVPAGTVAAIQAVCAGQAAASPAALAIAKGAVKAMFWVQVKLAAVVLAGAAVLAGGGTVAARALTAPAGDERLSAMPDNSWLKLDPPREPVGRAYCSVEFGGGYLWYFGGGKHTYLGNDVELFDVRRNRWVRGTEPEIPPKGSPEWDFMTSGGGGGRTLSPLGRPYAEQLQQQVCWVPERRRFLAVFATSGTWEFDPDARKWTHLVNRYQNPEAEPRGGGGQNQVLWDPALGAPVHAVNSGPDAHFRVFDFGVRAWRRLAPVPAELKGNGWHSTWVPEWKTHLVAAGDTGGARFYRLDLASGVRVEPVSAPAELAGCDSLDCDPVNRVIVALEADRPARPWRLDLATGGWEQLSPSGQPPSIGGLWGTFKYDPAHGAFLFVCFEGNRGLYQGGPASTWAYRYRRAAEKQ
jgi:RNA polymerase sigma factor (sigma-70 family)